MTYFYWYNDPDEIFTYDVKGGYQCDKEDLLSFIKKRPPEVTTVYVVAEEIQYGQPIFKSFYVYNYNNSPRWREEEVSAYVLPQPIIKFICRRYLKNGLV